MIGSDWKATIQAAAAFDADRFAICVGELEYDDPFTAIITYDGRFSQPWSRTDVEREIVDISYMEDEASGGPIPVALSNEGDVYVLKNEQVERSKILGAGVLSDDAEGFGAVHALVIDGDNQYVVGDSRQLYRREGLGTWQRLSADKSRQDGYEAEHFGNAISLEGSLLIESFQRSYSAPNAAQFDPKTWENVSPEQFLKMMKEQRSERVSRPRIQRVYHYLDGSFSRLSLPEDCMIKGLYRDPEQRIWLLSVGGLIMQGTIEGGFDKVGFHGDKETLFSAAWYRSELFVATDDGLRRFDGHKLSIVKPKLSSAAINRNVPAPLKIQSSDNTLVYFDRKHGVCRWDGLSWDWYEIPPSLLQREFRGLPARQ
ncbi:hypothetical protein IE4803_PC00419 (plasmid) [Rhizobium etli bv. phaseoli str. IE4803]|nr:hypothetical protein IE4803_PC00419 [Rhizobium etli bv. phaseoli str. IE4803]